MVSLKQPQKFCNPLQFLRSLNRSLFPLSKKRHDEGPPGRWSQPPSARRRTVKMQELRTLTHGQPYEAYEAFDRMKRMRPLSTPQALTNRQATVTVLAPERIERHCYSSTVPRKYGLRLVNKVGALPNTNSNNNKTSN